MLPATLHRQGASVAGASTPTGLTAPMSSLPPGAALNVLPSSLPSMQTGHNRQPLRKHHHRPHHHHLHDPSKSVEKTRALHFHRKYAELCRQRNVQPLSELRERTKSVLDFHCDHMRLDDWKLVLQALMGDTALLGLGIRARKPCTHVLESVDTEKKCRGVRNQPPFCTKFIFQPLVEIVSNCVAHSTVLNALILEGLPLNGRYVQQIARALLLNATVRYVSLARSNVADDGCEQLCTTLKHLPNVDRLNFSGCQLSTRGAESIAALLKYQKIIRYTEGWRQSLRYRDVDADQIPGLKYVALNQNVDVGDAGLHALLAVLVEDEWIRGMEMQQCGVTDAGAQAIVECLNVNKALLVFDVRNNAGISGQTMNRMRQQLGIESDATETTSIADGAGAAGALVSNGAARLSTKARIAISKERICSLEQQLATEVEQRKQAEAMNERLHQQMMEAQRKITAQPKLAETDADHAERIVVAAAKLSAEFTLVSKEQLHGLLME